LFNDQALAVGWLPPPIAASQVKAPSEMFAVADARLFFSTSSQTPGPLSSDTMECSGDGGNEITTPRHGKGLNVLCADGHIELIPRLVLLDPRKSGRRWNNDNQEHKETWFLNP
jgi:prepilin-type processing-associated H-X9-DG protein